MEARIEGRNQPESYWNERGENKGTWWWWWRQEAYSKVKGSWVLKKKCPSTCVSTVSLSLSGGKRSWQMGHSFQKPGEGRSKGDAPIPDDSDIWRPVSPLSMEEKYGKEREKKKLKGCSKKLKFHKLIFWNGAEHSPIGFTVQDQGRVENCLGRQGPRCPESQN